MSVLHRERIETKTHKEIAGTKCDGCGKEDLHGPPPGYESPGVATVARQPGWIGLALAGWNKYWDICPDCLPKLEATLLGPMPFLREGRAR